MCLFMNIVVVNEIDIVFLQFEQNLIIKCIVFVSLNGDIIVDLLDQFLIGLTFDDVP